MNPCSETKAGHATAEENHGTIQKETPHLLGHLRNQYSKVYCRALSPQSMCSQPDPYYTRTLSNHRYVNEERSLLHSRATKCLQMQPSTRKLTYKEKVCKSATASSQQIASQIHISVEAGATEILDPNLANFPTLGVLLQH